MRGPKLIDVGVGVIVESRIDGSVIRGVLRAEGSAAASYQRENRNSPTLHGIRIP
jgi:hypothetical protein